MGLSTRLLVVDDVEDNREVLARRFAREGFEVVHADSGEAALAVILRERIDVVVLDVMMPGMSGLDVLRSLRAHPLHAAIPVIMATARADSAEVVAALDLGANDYVTKPVDFPVLAARVRAALRTRPRARPRRSGAELLPGSVLGQRYRIDAKIGEGGFGVVFRALHVELQRDIAINLRELASGKWSSIRATRRAR